MVVEFLLMLRRPPRSTRTYTLFPCRRSSDLAEAAGGHQLAGRDHHHRHPRPGTGRARAAQRAHRRRHGHRPVGGAEPGARSKGNHRRLIALAGAHLGATALDLSKDVAKSIAPECAPTEKHVTEDSSRCSPTTSTSRCAASAATKIGRAHV